MTQHQALQDLDASLRRDSATPTIGHDDREAFLSEEREKLRALVIDPVPVKVQTNEWVREYAEFNGDSYEMLAIAGRGNNWLLYDPSNRLFSLGSGALADSLTLVGFRSDDALAEWRG